MVWFLGKYPNREGFLYCILNENSTQKNKTKRKTKSNKNKARTHTHTTWTLSLILVNRAQCSCQIISGLLQLRTDLGITHRAPSLPAGWHSSSRWGGGASQCDLCTLRGSVPCRYLVQQHLNEIILLLSPRSPGSLSLSLTDIRWNWFTLCSYGSRTIL